MGKKKQIRAQESFSNLVSNSTISKFKPYINELVFEAVEQAGVVYKKNILELAQRVVVLEDFVCGKLSISREELVKALADKQDLLEGLTEVDTVEMSDRTRLTIKTKKPGEAEFSSESRVLIDNTGSGDKLGVPFETNVVGMKTGENKEIELDIGPEMKITVSVTVDKISRKIVKQKEEIKDENINA